tara:strand:+ start:87 stop:542 length:456 start_codon:yes stop_codon:yes gene_type:complete
MPTTNTTNNNNVIVHFKNHDADTDTDDLAITNKTLSFLKEKLKGVDIRPSTVHLILKYTMEYIEKTPVKGIKQKQITLNVLRALFVDLTDGNDEKVLLSLLEDGTISNLIDLIVDVSKGKLDINTLVDTAEVTYGCAKYCLPYLFSRKKKN